jgi:hypothetical protein
MSQAEPASAGSGASLVLECPLTMEVMRDPVITADGQTYERAEIEKWFCTWKSDKSVDWRRAVQHESLAQYRTASGHLRKWVALTGMMGHRVGQVLVLDLVSCAAPSSVQCITK